MRQATSQAASDCFRNSTSTSTSCSCMGITLRQRSGFSQRLRTSGRIQIIAPYNEVLLLFTDLDSIYGVGCEGTAGVSHILEKKNCGWSRAVCFYHDPMMKSSVFTGLDRSYNTAELRPRKAWRNAVLPVPRGPITLQINTDRCVWRFSKSTTFSLVTARTNKDKHKQQDTPTHKVLILSVGQGYGKCIGQVQHVWLFSCLQRDVAVIHIECVLLYVRMLNVRQTDKQRHTHTHLWLQ